ncbi:MAG: ribonuclease P protein component [Peptococcaceae bacterium]|nr:ribonuclease P protein component [Peptococcaceae bacterium]MDH7523824.1 ribonuclease P protein component [Peptococcaceae bacterium]
MLEKKFRLKSKSRIKEVYARGKSLVNPYLVLYYYLKDTKSENVKICFAVSKKLGSAVERNRTKRRMREAIKRLVPVIKKEYNLIFIAREKIKGISFVDVEKNMEKLLKKAGLVLDEKE